MRGNAEGLTKRQQLPSDTAEKSRSLRRASTEAERHLWHTLRDAFPHTRFRRQVPIGRYFADLCTHAHKLVIELDGGQHTEANDAERTRFIEGEGYKVVRFWNHDVLNNTAGVLATVAAHFPSPLVGEGGAKRRMRGSPKR